MNDYLWYVIIVILAFLGGFFRAHYDATVFSTCKVRSLEFVRLWIKETLTITVISVLAGILAVSVLWLIGI